MPETQALSFQGHVEASLNGKLGMSDEHNLLQPCVDAAFQDLTSHHELDMLHRVLTSKHGLMLLHEPYQ